MEIKYYVTYENGDNRTRISRQIRHKVAESENIKVHVFIISEKNTCNQGKWQRLAHNLEESFPNLTVKYGDYRALINDPTTELIMKIERL